PPPTPARSLAGPQSPRSAPSQARRARLRRRPYARASSNVGLRPTPRLGRSRGPSRPAPLPRRRAVRTYADVHRREVFEDTPAEHVALLRMKLHAEDVAVGDAGGERIPVRRGANHHRRTVTADRKR